MVIMCLAHQLPDGSSSLPEGDIAGQATLLLGLAPGGVCRAGLSPNRWWALALSS